MVNVKWKQKQKKHALHLNFKVFDGQMTAVL